MAFDLINNRFDGGNLNDSADLFAVEIRQANAFDTAGLYKLFEFVPCQQIVQIDCQGFVIAVARMQVCVGHRCCRQIGNFVERYIRNGRMDQI